MERLSEKLVDILNEQDFCFDPEEWVILRTALARFKDYENTGLKPDEIMTIRIELDGVKKELDAAIEQVEKFMVDEVLDGNEPCDICAKAYLDPCEYCDPKWRRQHWEE